MAAPDHLAIAGSLNDELTIILSAEHAVYPCLDPSHPAASWLYELRRAAVRAAELTRRLQHLPQPLPNYEP